MLVSPAPGAVYRDGPINEEALLPPSHPPPPHHSLSRPSASKTQLAASLGGVWGSGEAAAPTADVQINISRH